MKFSLVVPTRKRPKKLKRLLDSVERLKETLPSEVIVVIDGSDNMETIDAVEEWKGREHKFRAIALLNRVRGGPGMARNLGLKKATGDMVAFTDDDCVADTLWLHHYAQYFGSNECVAGAGGRVLPVNGDIISKFMTIHKVLEPPETLLYLVTANCCYHREQLLEIGGFPASILSPGGEDVLVGMKLSEKGQGLGYCQEAVVFHEYRPGLSDFFRTFHNYGKGCASLTREISLDGGQA